MAYGLDDFLSVGSTFVADGDDRGLIEHNAFVAGEYQGVGCAKINGKVGGEVPTESSEHSRILSGMACASACHRRVYGVKFRFFRTMTGMREGIAAKPG